MKSVILLVLMKTCPWCVPLQAPGGLVETLRRKYDVDVLEIDKRKPENSELVDYLGIKTVPSFFIFSPSTNLETPPVFQYTGQDRSPEALLAAKEMVERFSLRVAKNQTS